MHQPLVEVERSDFVESMHFGSLVILDESGTVTFAIGDTDTAMHPRSASKLVQAAGVLAMGVELSAELIAIAASSHSGGRRHVNAVLALLNQYGLRESDLQNTPSLPIGAPERTEYVGAGGEASSLRADCSGKHASFLAACKVNDWPLESYLQPDHPLQQRLRDFFQSTTEVEILADGVDGCGAPLWSTTLTALATVYRQAALGVGLLGKVGAAMSQHPDLVGGSGRIPTLVMQSSPGMVAKDGAEAVFAMASGNGQSAAFKISDGGRRAVAPVAQAVLDFWGIQAELPFEPVLGGGKQIGQLRLAASANLR